MKYFFINISCHWFEA